MYYCRYAPSLGALEGTPEEVWGTPPYNPRKHRQEATVFFGLYDLRDYIALYRHKGKAWVLWAGSDITNFKAGFIFNNGKLRTLSKIFKGFFKKWIRKTLEKAEHWVENEREKITLEDLGIEVTGVCPSFMGNIDDFQDCYEYKGIPQVYVSCSGNRQQEYGFGITERIAGELPGHYFHLFGGDWETKHENVHVHGRIPKEEMNRRIQGMQIGLRLNDFDGFSEITAKAVLMGQHAITKVAHPHIMSFSNDASLIEQLKKCRRKHPAKRAQKWYRENLNNYPWKS